MKELLLDINSVFNMTEKEQLLYIVKHNGQCANHLNCKNCPIAAARVDYDNCEYLTVYKKAIAILNAKYKTIDLIEYLL